MEKVPVFVKIDDYKESLVLMNQIKEKTREARNVLEELSDLKNQEDEELRAWRENLAEVERKIDFINKFLGGQE